MYLSSEYEADELKSICVEVMKDRIEANLLPWTLELAIDCNSVQLHEICLKQIKINWSEAINSDWFPNLQHKALEDILRIKCSQRNEKVLFERCIEWAKRVCDEDEELETNTPADWRRALNDYIGLINFDRMTKDDFKSLKGIEILSTNEINGNATQLKCSKKLSLK